MQQAAQQAEQAGRMAARRRRLTAFVNTIPPPAEFSAASDTPLQTVRAQLREGRLRGRKVGAGRGHQRKWLKR